MTINASCDECGARISDEDAVRFMNMSSKYHVVFTCECGHRIEQKRIVECCLEHSRMLLSEYRAKK